MAEEQRKLDRPKVVGVFSLKGGVGKTTVGFMAAHLAAKTGRRPVFLDLDLPGTDAYVLADPPKTKKSAPSLLELLVGVDVESSMTYSEWLGNKLKKFDATQLGTVSVAHTTIPVWFSTKQNDGHSGNIESDLPEAFNRICGVGVLPYRLTTLIERLIVKNLFDVFILDLPPFFVGLARTIWETIVINGGSRKESDGRPEFDSLALVVLTADPRELGAFVQIEGATEVAKNDMVRLIVNFSHPSLGPDIKTRSTKEKDPLKTHLTDTLERRGIIGGNQEGKLRVISETFLERHAAGTTIEWSTLLAAGRSPESVAKLTELWENPAKCFSEALRDACDAPGNRHSMAFLGAE
jgi:hypothetical protein